MISSCGPDQGNQPDKQAVSGGTAAAGDIQTVPGIEKLEFSDSIKLQADENMRFNRELFRVRAGVKLSLILKNASFQAANSMTHNVVILKSGTDLADFAEVAGKAKNQQYIPSELDSLIIAHTRLVPAGGSDTVECKIPRKGVYDFICSFPGHWGTMQGKIVAE